MDFSQDHDQPPQMQIEGFDPDLEQELHNLEVLFHLHEEQPPASIDALLEEVYEYGHGDFNAESALQRYEQLAADTVNMQGYAEAVANADLLTRVNVLIRAVQESYSILCATNNLHGNAALSMSTEDMLLRYVKTDDTKDLAIQSVYKFILAWCRRLKLRHKGHTVYKEVYTTPEGFGTHAWVPARDHAEHDLSTIELLVAFICTRVHNTQIWNLWLSVNTKALVDKLAISLEGEFPVLHTTRAWLAFGDGLYGVYIDTFVPYAQLAEFGIPASLAACSYHAVNFKGAYHKEGRPGVPKHALVEVDTPLLDGLMETQRWCGHTKFWLLAMLGRVLYTGSVLDQWQVASYFKGLAGTGKSTLVDLMVKIYDPSDTVTISNDTQAGFGLQNITIETLLIAIPEIKTDFSMEQAQFQSIVTQERTSIGRKHLGPLDCVITAPLLMAGNSLPLRWSDNSGSIRRRIVLFYFGFCPSVVQTDLPERLKTEELPYIIRKINHCYRTAVVLLNKRDLWQSNLLPQHILTQNDIIFESMNTLRKFVNDSSMQRHPDNWCPVSHFQQVFRDYCHRINAAHSQWNADFYDHVFKGCGLAVKEAVYRWDSNPAIGGSVVVGIISKVDKQCGKMTVTNDEDNPAYIEDNIDEGVDIINI